jgi:type II secretory pathway pseudopilin PulG
MTLVELLVVVAIMVILLAVSVPMLRPMLESQKTSNAAQVLAGAFKHARTKSMQEQQSYGIRLIPYDNAPTTAVELRLHRGTAGADVFVNDPNERVKVVQGKIVPYRFDAGGWHETGYDAVKEHFQDGGTIQFNRLGRSFEFEFANGVGKLTEPYDQLNLPEDESNDAMEYRIAKPSGGGSALAWLPPVVMPHGMIVDLAFSGGEETVPVNFEPGDDVVVMFSPMGYVDAVYINTTPYNVNEMLYFCVGEWDRQIGADGVALAEDKRSNLRTPATYWVTLHPKTGGVRTAENAPFPSDSETPIRDARRFAREHFFNVGDGR